MSKRDIEPGWREPVQDVASDEWEAELNALHETVVRVVAGTETPIAVHTVAIPNGREGLPLDADGEVRSNTRNKSNEAPALDATDTTPAGDAESPAIMRAFSAGTGFVKDNAVAAAATAAGIGWLIWNARTTPGPAPTPDIGNKSIKNTASDVADKVKDAGGNALNSIKEVGGNAVEGAKSMTSGVLESVKSAGGNAAHTATAAVSSAAHTATTAVSGAAQKVGSTSKEQAKRVGSAALGVAKASPIELAVTVLSAVWLYRSARPEPSVGGETSKLDQLGDQAKTGSRTALQAIENAVRSNPLATGAIALTIGAIVGLLIPESTVENRLMGPKHDELLDKAMGAAQEFTEDIKDKVMAVATEAVNTVKSEAKNQGLVPGAESPTSGAGEIPVDSDEADKSPANAI